MAGVLYFFLRPFLGREGVMQRLHFLVGFLHITPFRRTFQRHPLIRGQPVVHLRRMYPV